MNDKNLNLKTLIGKARDFLPRLSRYSLLSFVVLVAVVYGFVAYKITSLRNLEPTDTEVSQQVKAANVPHIDEKVVKQLQSLQDNSVSVQALFDEARSNPFQ